MKIHHLIAGIAVAVTAAGCGANNQSSVFGDINAPYAQYAPNVVHDRGDAITGIILANREPPPPVSRPVPRPTLRPHVAPAPKKSACNCSGSGTTKKYQGRPMINH